MSKYVYRFDVLQLVFKLSNSYDAESPDPKSALWGDGLVADIMLNKALVETAIGRTSLSAEDIVFAPVRHEHEKEAPAQKAPLWAPFVVRFRRYPFGYDETCSRSTAAVSDASR